MFRFHDPEYLYLLCIIPIFALLYIYGIYQRQKNLAKLGEKSLIAQLMPLSSLSRQIVKFIILQLALACLIVAWARPQMGMRISTEERKGIEMVVAMDISNSMLATDVSPNRLDKAKMLVSNMADKFNDDKIALVVFAGQAFIQLPITSDFVSAKMFLDAISPKLIQLQGTNIGEAIRLAMGSFTQKKGIERAIAIITDGEDQAEEAENMAKEAAKKGIHIYVLGIGTDKGGTIPVGNGQMLRDREGNIVVTKLNENMANSIATAGKGAYIHVDNSNIAQERLNYELSKLKKSKLSSDTYSDYAEQYQIFLLAALLLLITDVLILSKKGTIFQRLNFFNHHEKK